MKYEIVASHQSDLLTQDLILTGIFQHCKFKEYGLSFDFPYIRYEHETGDISYPSWQIKEIKALDLSEKELKKLTNFLETELSRYHNFLKEFEKQITSPADKEKKIQQFFKESLRAVATIPFFAFEMSLYKKLEKEGISPKDIPSSPTDTSLASLELKKIAKKYENELTQTPISENLKKDLKKFCERFGYLGMIYFKGSPWTIQEAYKMLFTHESTKEKQEKKIKNPSIYLDFASKLLKLRTQKWETMCYGTYLFRKYIKRFFADEIVYDKLLNLRIDEVLNIINGKHSLEDKSQIREYFVLEIKENGVFLSTKKKAREIKEIEEKEIKGVTAHPGKVKGIVKIVLTAKENYKVNPGDILVTKMSTPDFLPAMGKAAAFVTDIGGITCHAAIVSREMGKPCIIGTNIATKVLKDGDLVEVDANKGVVKKLK